MDRRVLREALRLSEAHVPYVLATVIDAQGSVPGKKGVSLLVRADGSILGTVGGAGLEEKVRFLARQALRRREGGLHRFDLRAWKPGGLPSLCGGSVDVALQYVPARPNILLWGGGHVALALSRIFPLMDYDFSVADDRSEFAAEERFPRASHRWTVPPSELLATMERSEENFSHVYLLGYDAKKDEEVAFHLLPKLPRAHIGLIASRSKREIILRSLRSRGIAEEDLRRLRSPIGIPMHAETPEEIAVSVVGEIIQDLHPSGPDGAGSEATAEEAARHAATGSGRA